MGQPSCFLALPSYGGVYAQSMFSAWNCGSKMRVCPVPGISSDMDHNYTLLLCLAINAPENFDYFAMLHSDVNPEQGWLDILMEEMELLKADVLSVVIPIKEETAGVTSTGLGIMGNWTVKRLTMTEVMELPISFSVQNLSSHYPFPYLAINTGCMLWSRKTRDWWRDFAKQGGFRHQGWVTEDSQGHLQASTFAEDWKFSRWAASQNLSVYATRKVKLNHYGPVGFPNTHAWGQWKTDQDFKGF
jgi:hypothetical protein